MTLEILQGMASIVAYAIIVFVVWKLETRLLKAERHITRLRAAEKMREEDNKAKIKDTI